MTEIEKIKYTKMFIDKMANGINPINDLAVSENDLINNVRISRCLFYVSEILQQVIEHGGIAKKNELKRNFSITDEELANFPYSEELIPISEITKRISNLVDLDIQKPLGYKKILDWLVETELLEVIIQPDGRAVKRPTDKGCAIGVFTEERMGRDGRYVAVLYNMDAQKLIIDNLVEVLER